MEIKRAEEHTFSRGAAVLRRGSSIVANTSPGSFPAEGVTKVRRKKSEGEPHWGTSTRGGGWHYRSIIFNPVILFCRRAGCAKKRILSFLRILIRLRCARKKRAADTRIVSNFCRPDDSVGLTWPLARNWRHMTCHMTCRRNVADITNIVSMLPLF